MLFWITFSSLAGRSVLAGGLHFVTIFGPSFRHRFWSLFWAPNCPQIQGLLMNLVFVAQFWNQIWPPKREPKTFNFLPRNLDTFQPNFEQNLTKIPKSWKRENHIANTQKRPEHVLQTGSTSWPPSPRLRGIFAARKRNTHPLALWCNHHGEACFGACLGACFRHLSWFNQVAAKRFSCVPLASKCHKSQATRPCSKTRRA